MESKRMKMEEEEEKEDRLSELPDSLIHHILSLLPSTKQAVQTGILSKRWENQWTQLPVLIFDSTPGMSHDSFLKFIDNTLILHSCSKIKKFILVYRHSTGIKDPNFSAKIRFAIRKHVEQLILHSVCQEYILPTFLFNNASSLLELRTCNCSFIMPNGKVNWKCLTKLFMGSCRLPDQAMELILSGSPQLEMIVLNHCFGFTKLVIASNSLKTLLVLGNRPGIFDLEISCPKLVKVHLLGVLNVRNAKLPNLPSLIYATIDFNHHKDECNDIRMSLIKDILQQLRHVKVLTFGNWFMEYVSAILARGQFSPVLNTKCLTLRSHNIPGIVCLLGKSPMLEILAVDVRYYDQDYRDFGENYGSDASISSCLASHLKTINITGFPKRDGKHKVMLNFIQFFLKNARVLEKMVVNLKDDGTGFPLKVSQELLRFPRCSQCATIELICSK